MVRMAVMVTPLWINFSICLAGPDIGGIRGIRMFQNRGPVSGVTSH